jgi:hypothetical protein
MIAGSNAYAVREDGIYRRKIAGDISRQNLRTVMEAIGATRVYVR